MKYSPAGSAPNTALTLTTEQKETLELMKLLPTDVQQTIATYGLGMESMNLSDNKIYKTELSKIFNYFYNLPRLNPKHEEYDKYKDIQPVLAYADMKKRFFLFKKMAENQIQEAKNLLNEKITARMKLNNNGRAHVGISMVDGKVKGAPPVIMIEFRGEKVHAGAKAGNGFNISGMNVCIGGDTSKMEAAVENNQKIILNRIISDGPAKNIETLADNENALNAVVTFLIIKTFPASYGKNMELNLENNKLYRFPVELINHEFFQDVAILNLKGNHIKSISEKFELLCPNLKTVDIIEEKVEEIEIEEKVEEIEIEEKVEEIEIEETATNQETILQKFYNMFQGGGLILSGNMNVQDKERAQLEQQREQQRAQERAQREQEAAAQRAQQQASIKSQSSNTQILDLQQQIAAIQLQIAQQQQMNQRLQAGTQSYTTAYNSVSNMGSNFNSNNSGADNAAKEIERLLKNTYITADQRESLQMIQGPEYAHEHEFKQVIIEQIKDSLRTNNRPKM